MCLSQQRALIGSFNGTESNGFQAVPRFHFIKSNIFLIKIKCLLCDKEFYLRQNIRKKKFSFLNLRGFRRKNHKFRLNWNNPDRQRVNSLSNIFFIKKPNQNLKNHSQYQVINLLEFPVPNSNTTHKVHFHQR